MRYLILSDLHANRQALEAVLADVRGQYDTIACCGDIVGYGADPVWALEWVRANVPTVVRGNHDKACAGLEDLEWFNPAARRSALWTLSQLNSDQIEWLRNLPQGPVELNGFDLIHGSPIDEDEYVIGVREAAEVSHYLETQTTFFGHTHLQGGFLLHRNGVRALGRPRLPDTQLVVELEPDAYYLLNPGSVGQPRDADPRAAYCVYDSELRVVTYFRVSYDVAAAQARIRDAGLPAIHAERLSAGY